MAYPDEVREAMRMAELFLKDAVECGEPEMVELFQAVVECLRTRRVVTDDEIKEGFGPVLCKVIDRVVKEEQTRIQQN